MHESSLARQILTAVLDRADGAALCRLAAWISVERGKRPAQPDRPEHGVIDSVKGGIVYLPTWRTSASVD